MTGETIRPDLCRSRKLITVEMVKMPTASDKRDPHGFDHRTIPYITDCKHAAAARVP